MINTTYFYLIEGIDNNPYKIYIGKSKQPYFRKSFHKSRFGDDISFIIIDEINSLERKDWKPIECYWIEQFKHWGFDVMNRNNGGGGTPYHTEYTKKLLSKPKPEGFGDKVRKRLKGIPQTEKTRIKRSISSKGKPKPLRTKEHNSKFNKPVSQYNKQNIFIKVWDSRREASLALNICEGSISSCVKGKLKTAGKFIWK
jgi:hypothetical protein